MQLRREAEPRRRGAVVGQQSLQAVDSAGRYSRPRKPGALRSCGQQQRAVLLQILGGLGLQRVLILRVGLPAADADVLHRLQKRGRAGHARQLGPQPVDDLLARSPCARSSGFSAMNVKPPLVAPCPPVNPITFSTPGSALMMLDRLLHRVCASRRTRCPAAPASRPSSRRYPAAGRIPWESWRSGRRSAPGCSTKTQQQQRGMIEHPVQAAPVAAQHAC